MERNVQKNGLVNLVAAVVIFIAAFVVTCYVDSLAGLGCSIFLGLGALVAFASWFQMRLEENERLEKLDPQPASLPGKRLCPGFRMGWLWGRIGVALGWLEGRMRVACGSHAGGLRVACGWLVGRNPLPSR